ncbi:MAG: hypothetical protein ACPIA7_01240 [Akkermansiaceae bacterium]
MSDTIKGSDGIERTLDEWRLFIEQTVMHVNDDGELDKELTKAKWDVRYYFQCQEDGISADTDLPELTNYIGESAMDFFREALMDASLQKSEARKMDRLSSHMRSFADRLTSKMDQRVHEVGYALLQFIDKHNRLPDQPKDLEVFTEESPTMQRIPRKTISEWLPEYRLGEVVRGNKRRS